MEDPAIEAIKASPMFSGLREEDVVDLVNGGRRRIVEPGACLIKEGDWGDSLLVILSGEVEVVRDTGDSETMLAHFGAGSYVGEMSLIDNAPRTATVRSLTKSEVLEITREQFDHLLDESPDACRALIRTILGRLKSTEGMLVNQEKMAALGRVTAGLAHELNNPASAVSRFASQLAHSLDEWQSATARLAQVSDLKEIEEVVRRHEAGTFGEASDPPAFRNALERADLEEELARWMISHDVQDPWDAAVNLAAEGWTPDQLARFVEDSNAPDRSRLIEWLSARSSIRATLQQMRTSAERLSEIVNAVKRYSHMDQAPVSRLNVNQGIETTLVILKHKMREITLNLEFDSELPEIDGYPAELNQVWTNLIDNAVDAMHGSGALTITTRSDRESVIVTFTDDGDGIPDAYLDRLFEPFFTTKAVGVGTGLGLHISRNIIVQRHGGAIEVESEPGRTTFTVTLPIHWRLSDQG
jgi:signal transduction histidine kinase